MGTKLVRRMNEYQRNKQKSGLGISARQSMSGQCKNLWSKDLFSDSRLGRKTQASPELRHVALDQPNKSKANSKFQNEKIVHEGSRAASC